MVVAVLLFLGLVVAGAGASSALASHGCTVADTSHCLPGTTLTFTDSQFHCNRPLAQYGALPLKVVLNYTPGRRYGGNGAVDLFSGCAGDGDPQTIDLIVDVRGDGVTHGPGVDAFKVRQEAGWNGSIELTGHVDCGPKYTPDQHQDGVQLQGGRNITFVDFSVGNFDAGLSTCQGAGGAFFYSGASGYVPTNINVVRGKYIACNHSLFTAANATGSIAGAWFRSGRTDGTEPFCDEYAGAPPCTGENDVIAAGVKLGPGVVCERWNRTTDMWQSELPGLFADVTATNPFHAHIEQLYHRGITTGCGTTAGGALLFCPLANVPRQQMAAFLMRASGQTPLLSPVPTFTDVGPSNPFYGWIERLYQQGVTTGCSVSPRRYCPTANVTRAEMGAFLMRAKGQTPLDPGAPTFADVPRSHQFFGWIERLYAEGVTTGCGTNSAGQRLYCPTQFVPRQQMAAFLIRAFP